MKDLQGIIENYSECFKFFKFCYRKRYITFDLPQDIVPRWEIICPIILATFSSTACCLNVLSWFKMLSQPFCLQGQARSHMVPDPIRKVDKDTHVFHRPCISTDQHLPTALIIFLSYPVKTQKKTSRTTSESGKNDGTSVSKVKGNVSHLIHPQNQKILLNVFRN